MSSLQTLYNGYPPSYSDLDIRLGESQSETGRVVSVMLSDHFPVMFDLSVCKPPFPTKELSFCCYKKMSLLMILFLTLSSLGFLVCSLRILMSWLKFIMMCCRSYLINMHM